MGIYDRDYERQRDYGDSPGFHLGGDLSWSSKLVIVMAIVYVVQLLTNSNAPAGGWFTQIFELHADLPREPWMAFQLVTYGFLHNPGDLKHILFNCFGLWMFGRSVESHYGKKEYLAFFLVSVMFAGAFWVASEFVANRQLLPMQLIGASGGVVAVLILFCLNYPRQQIFIWGVFPMPAWVFAILIVGFDLISSVDNKDSHIAYMAHIGGALFALVYFKAGWRLSNWLPGGWKMPKLGRRPSLRVHDPADEIDDATEDAVDNILRKIRERGQDSLTREERRILEEASREYQKRRQ
jgi:membrane associated rhomboid family serine protease